MLSRRRKAPPLEVMGNPTRSAPAARPPNGPVRASAAEPAVITRSPEGLSSPQPSPPPLPRPAPAHPAGDAPATSWWSMTNRPLVLRLPQGVLVLAVVGLVALLALAGWVGHELAKPAGTAAAPADPTRGPGVINSYPRFTGGTEKPVGSAPPPNTGARAPGGSTRQTGTPAPGGVASRPTARQAGLNYLILATYPKDEADRLVEFLGQNGVEAAAFPWQNRGLYHVVALRGFAGPELRTAAYDTYKQELLRLGRLWNRKAKGPGDLHDMWPQKYEPAPAPETPATPERKSR